MGCTTSADEYNDKYTYRKGSVRNNRTGNTHITVREKARNNRGCYSQRPAGLGYKYDNASKCWKSKH